jgi:hypothetical protein
VKGRLGRDATLLQKRALTVFFSSTKTREEHMRSGGVKQIDMECGKG